MKKSIYNYSVSKQNYSLIFNGRKGTILVLEPDVALRFENDNLTDDEVEKLKELGMLVEDDINEVDLFLTESRFSTSKKNRIFFRIYTTMACNAKCPYCYEKGLTPISMTQQIADDVIDYIISSITVEKLVIVEWFGGEPLCNNQIITYISTKLVEKLDKMNVKYFSNMVSNGYLFDAKMIDDAVNIWKLRKIQITLDGTSENYERIKQFGDVNSLQKVLKNIEMLTEKSIFVNVRINYDENNFDDVCKLIEQLSIKFAKNKFFGIYGHKIMREDANNSFIASEDLDLKFLKKLISSGFSIDFKMTLNPRIDVCFAYLINGGLIYPNGDIYKCSKVAGNTKERVSTIYEKKYNNNISKWCSPRLPSKCLSCKYLPLCNGGCLNERRLGKEPCFISDKILKYKLDSILEDYIAKKH